ncbi:hypothetical protein VE03_05647 [Pseudogymnoascus sp. 23342-1-I1]|nr:hypothetical protein VE03_05647 [Pseudogymnoascus sp. 23342-1-I1]
MPPDKSVHGHGTCAELPRNFHGVWAMSVVNAPSTSNYRHQLDDFKLHYPIKQLIVTGDRHNVSKQCKKEIVTKTITQPQPSIPSTSILHQAPNQNRWQQPTANDPQWLERALMDQNSSESIYPDPMLFKTCPVIQITKSASYVYQNPTSPSSPGEINKCIWLPDYDEANSLVQKYLSDITYIHHVVHSPTVRKVIDEIYEDLSKGISPKVGHIALLLSIIASATYSWTSRDSIKVFPTVGDADRQCPSWIKATLDVLEYSRRTTSGAIEDIQAIIIISFVVTNLEGVSPKYRNLISTAITLGREILLHRIDHPSNSGLLVISPADSVRAEIGRRVWWYLTATDWMLSRYAGPQEGAYTVNPRHMAVNKPRNINDEDLVDGMGNAELPLSQPTSMSYFLQRIRLAELSREFTDQATHTISNPELVGYAQVMEIDAKFDCFIKDIPSFFSLKGGTIDKIAKTDPRGAPGIVIQRYILNSLVYAHRCKLHVPYLKRGSIDPAYARSREICLHAARMIIQTERQLEEEDLPFVLTRLKFSGMLYCVAMAIIALILDVCFNKSAADYDAKKIEVVDACNILDAAKGQSAMAAKLLGSLLSVLPKYQVTLNGVSGTQVSHNGPPPDGSKVHDANISDMGECRLEDRDTASGEVPSIAEISQSFDYEMDLDTLDWNSFFSEMDSQVI